MSVTIKHGSTRHAVPLTDLTPKTLETLTNVPPHRQTLLHKGKRITLQTPDTTQFKEGDLILLMGSKEVEIPKNTTVFVEDMPESEKAKLQKEPIGLVNLGNTCYMNATLQCLRKVPPLVEAVKGPAADSSTYSTIKFSGQITPGQSSRNVTAIAKSLFTQMSQSLNSVNPTVFWMTLMDAYPQFGEMVEGRYAQQDAEECWSHLMSAFQSQVKNTGDAKGAIDQYTSGTWEVKKKCIEAENEPIETVQEQFFKLGCHIDMETNYLHQGLKTSQKEHFEKNSPTLGRTAQYEKNSTICRFPSYLTIQMMRMFYKVDTAKKAKIMRKVKFAIDLDLAEMASPELRPKLEPGRQLYRLQQDRRDALRKLKNKKDAGTSPDIPAAPTFAEWKAEGKFDEALVSDVGCSLTAQYTLLAVLTHTGRSADSGHYMAWAKENGEWYKYDDDKVTPVTEAQILELDGGGDRAMAYLLVYGAIPLE